MKMASEFEAILDAKHPVKVISIIGHELVRDHLSFP
jgi:hypothetical protein